MANLDDAPPDSSKRPADLARIIAEQQRLRDRQDELEIELRRSRKDEKDDDDKDGDKDGDKDKDAKDGDKADAKDGKDGKDEEKKPPLKERLGKEFHEHPVRSIGIVVVGLLLVVGGLGWYLHSRNYEDTDDAQIDADISAVSPRVNGTIAAVYVVDNQPVHAGDLLAEMDARDLDAALAQAKANLQQAEAQLKADKPSIPITTVTSKTSISTSTSDVATASAEFASSQRDLAKAQADIEQAEANERYAEVERGRIARLAAVGAVAISQSDQRMTQAQTATANVEAAQQSALAARHKIDEQRAKLAAAQDRLEQSRANAPRQVEQSEAQVALREAMVAASRAQYEQAQLNRSYARILAPVDGVVGKKNVNIGDRVAPGQQLVAITQTTNLWVTANYRETQLRKMNPGQKTTVRVDALGLDFTGTVESMPGATGSRYSLLPPENATGNFVKVVQRLPVRIRLDPGQPGYDRLVPGMSVEPNVKLK